MKEILNQLNAEFERMEKVIAYQQEVISTIPSLTSACGKVMPSCLYGIMRNDLPRYPKLKLNDCTWAEIAMYTQSGMVDKIFEVGDAKTVQLKDGTSIDVRIIGFYHDKDADGRVLPISFETVQTLNDDEVMNEKYTNEGGWEKSFLRARLNGSFFDEMLPDDLKAAIKPCVKLTGTGGKNPVMGQTVDKLFVLSEQEIFGRKVFSMGGEGHWYDWYRQEDNPYGKVKQNGEADWRWERSPNGGDTTFFCNVVSTGNADYCDAYISFGVAFGFCV